MSTPTVGVLCYLLGAVVGIICGIILGVTLLGTHIVCITDGATLLHKSSPDQKYLTYYCVKNGKVVP